MTKGKSQTLNGLRKYVCKCTTNTVEPLYNRHYLETAGCPVLRGVPNLEVDLYTALWMGLWIVSSLERCPLFRVSFIVRFCCSWRSQEPLRPGD